MSDPELTAALTQARAIMHRGDYAAASAVCQQILGRWRNQRDAMLLLSEMANDVGDFELAEAHVRRAIKAHPRDAGLYLRLGQLYALRAKFPKAHDLIDKAIKLSPRFHAAIAAKAMVFERQDKYPKARALLRPFVAPGQPIEPETAAVYMRVLVHDDDTAEAAAFARRLLASGMPPSKSLRNALFAAVKAFEREGDYDGAFDVAQRANAIEPVPYDPGATTRLFDRYRAVFTRSWLAGLPRPVTVSALPVFIVGMPRCGSTLTERILDAHPDAFGADEIPAFHRIKDGLAADLGSNRAYPECALDLDADGIERNAARYLTELRGYHPTAIRISNKDLANFRHLGLIQALLPEARVIHCRRDPVDTCLSCFTERLRPSSNPFTTDLTHLGHYYRAYEGLMAHWRDVLDLRMLDVRYEELIADQEGVTRRILEFCELPWDERCLRFHESKRQDKTLSYDQVRRPLYGSSVGRAAAYGARLDPLRAALGNGGGG